MELDGAERGMGWLTDPEEPVLEAGEKGSIEGVLCELLTGAEVATEVNFSLRLALTAEAEGGKEDLIPMFDTDTLGIDVLSRVGLKLDDPKENETADGATRYATGAGARGVLGGGAKEKAIAPEPSVGLELSDAVEYGGGSPVTEADDFKDEEPKENTAEVPTTDGKEKVEVGATGNAGGTEAGAAAAEASIFCGA